MKLYGFLLMALCITGTAEAGCRTIPLPNTDGLGGLTTLTTHSPGGFVELVRYEPPANATSVGLEFWYHRFPYYQKGVDLEQAVDALDTSHLDHRLDLLVYLSEYDGQARRIFQTSNAQSGDPAPFPMSTFIHPGEIFQVVGVNHAGHDVPIKLIVTVRECTP